MPIPPDEALSTNLHEQASDLAFQTVDEFATSLVLQAKLIAFAEKAEVVLTNHIKMALDIIKKEPRRPLLRQILTIIGGAFFGAFVPGFATTLAAIPINIFGLVIYTVSGFLGLVLVFIGLKR